MADSILRLKVESQEYDSKLKRAAEGIQRLASKIHDSQGEFVGLTNDQKEFIKNLQYMNTVSQTATGKVKELETSYKGLQTMYNGFNAFEKNSEEGKILAEQLSVLKEKTLQARKEMEDANKSLSNTGGFLDQLTSKFTVNIDALKLFDIGMKAAGGALDVAKDAFFASEATVDEWGRVMDSSKSLYEGFLTSLNTGDISGFLGRIDSIVQAARAAYNELDRLGTMKTIQAPKMSAQQTENERMRMMIQTGRYIAPVDGRRASMQNGQLLTPDQIKRIEQQLQGGMQKVVTLVGNEVAQTGRAIDAVYNRQAQELGMSLKEFRKGTSSMAEFDKRMAGYEQYKEWDKQARTEFAKQGGRGYVNFDKSNPFAEFKKWGTFRVDGDRYNDLVKLIQQRDQQAGSLYGMQSQAYRTMNRAEGVTVSKLMRGGGTGGGGGRSGGGGGGGGFDISSIAFNAPQVTPEQMIAPPSVWEEYADGIKKTFGTIGDGMDNLTEWTNNFDPYTEKLNEMTKAAKQQQMAFGMAGQAADNLGAALAGMDDPAARAAGTVISAIANIALGFGQAVAQAGSMGPYAWLAYVAAGTAALATTISTVHSLTGYAQGGIVKGNSYSGDNIYGGPDAMVNAGELVLTKAQQGNLASQLQEGGMRNMNLSGRIRGTDIILSVDRTLSLEGKQLLTWGR